MYFNSKKRKIVGDGGSLIIAKNDDLARKFAMLIEGECEGIGPIKAAEKFGYTKQRYFQIRAAFIEAGSAGLISKARGPKGKSRRTSEVVRQIIRHRFLDPQASPEVIAQKLRQSGLTISTRSVERVFEDYGLQKKTLQVSSSIRKRKPTR
jgi:transposase